MCLRNKYTFTSQINGLLEQMQKYDTSLYEHGLRVGYLLWEISKELSLNVTMQQDTYLAGILHDFGKINIPPNILLRPGELSLEEFLFVKGHSEAGVNALEKYECLSKASLQGILQHHERADGSGYPFGITSVSMIGKILGVTDVFDALTNKRCYKESYSVELALRIIEKEPVVAYDKTIIHALEGIVLPNHFSSNNINSYTKRGMCQNENYNCTYTKVDSSICSSGYQFNEDSNPIKGKNTAGRRT